MTFIPLSVPVLKGNELKYVTECVETGWVSSAGSYVNLFEKSIAQFTGAGQAVACTSGTAALHTALMLCEVGNGDEVIVPTLTFIAPINTVKYVGAEPVFMDCDDFLNIDVDKTRDFCEKECTFDGKNLINKTTGRKVKAIIPVHIFGHPVNIDPLMELAQKFGLHIIEDATESLGSFYRSGKYEGRKTGCVGVIGCYSFNGNKIITTGGGGMLVTHDATLAEKARYLTTQAKDDEVKFIHGAVGYNYRLTNIQSAMGCAQMERLEEYVTIKRKNFETYESLLSKVEGLSLLKEPDYGFSNYWYYTLLIDEKKTRFGPDALLKELQANKIQTRPIWELNHRQKPYLGNQAYHIEKASQYHQKALSLPCSIDLTADQIEKVVSVIKNYHGK